MDWQNRLLCKKCLIDDGFFVGGGSWAADGCPKCGGTDCVWYEHIGPLQKLKAQKINDKMWSEKWLKKENQ